MIQNYGVWLEKSSLMLLSRIASLISLPCLFTLPVLITVYNDLIYMFTGLQSSLLKIILWRQEPICGLVHYSPVTICCVITLCFEWMNICDLGGKICLCPENFYMIEKNSHTRIQWTQGEVELLKKERTWLLVFDLWKGTLHFLSSQVAMEN